MDYLKDLLDKFGNNSSLIIWSDGCTYQNKCSNLSSALLSFAVGNNITIYHKYLEVGHTHMDVDSVHATIERAKKNQDIKLTTDYINVITSARKRNPYKVKYLDYNFFNDYKSVCDIASIKPSKAVGHPYVTDIRQLKYSPDGSMQFNLSYCEDKWQKLPYEINILHRTPPPRYYGVNMITYAKWHDLQDIKMTLPKDWQAFFDNLDHLPQKKKDLSLTI